MEKTTIEISVENWQWLSSLKRRPGDSFDDVLTRLRERDQAGPEDDGYSQNEGRDEVPDVQDDEGNEQVTEKIRSDGMTVDTGEAVSRDITDEVPGDLDLPGSGETFERRRETIGKLYAYLKEEGTATRSDFLELVDPDEVGYSSADSFWANSIKGRDSLSSLDGVVPPEEGGHNWRYNPDRQ